MTPSLATGVVNLAPTLELFPDPYVPFGRPASIRGRVTDPDMDGVEVTINYGDGSEPGRVTVNTASGGGFNLLHSYARGTYTVSAAARDDGGGESTAGTATLTAADLVGAVFEDAADDGSRDLGEAPVTGAIVFLDANGNGSADAGEATAITNDAGFYHFDSLAPGAYKVAYVPPAGWRLTDRVSSGPGTTALSDTQGGTRSFGISQKARISGVVFLDNDGDGVRDFNESVSLDVAAYIDVNNDGFRELGEPFLAGLGGDGYVFRNLEPGTYFIRIDSIRINSPGTYPSTYDWFNTQTLPAGGGNVARVVTVGPADSTGGNDFGIAYAGTAVSGYAFDDRDHNGFRNPGDAVLSGRTVYVDADGDGTMDPDERRVVTDAAGFYRIGLRPGTYALRQAVPEGWAQTIPGGAAGAYTVTIAGANQDGRDFGSYRVPDARVVGRHVFYNDSVFDGRDPAADDADDAAVATDKAAVLPGMAASFDNLTSYTRGLNGVMLDFTGLDGRDALGVTDFVCEQAGSAGATEWSAAPVPTSVTVRRGAGAGAGGSDRVTLTWADGAVRNAWLRVTVRANARTGLAAPDVFSFGNLIGETGDAATPLRVTSVDLTAVRRAMFSAAPVVSAYDFNRDGRVNALDLAAVRSNLNRVLAAPPAAARPSLAATDSATSLLRDPDPR